MHFLNILHFSMITYNHLKLPINLQFQRMIEFNSNFLIYSAKSYKKEKQLIKR
jgi:hypothetical protein